MRRALTDLLLPAQPALLGTHISSAIELPMVRLFATSSADFGPPACSATCAIDDMLSIVRAEQLCKWITKTTGTTVMQFRKIVKELVLSLGPNTR